MTPPGRDGQPVIDTLAAAVSELTSEMRQVGDPSAIGIGEWTVRELSAHLVAVFELYPRLLREEVPVAPTVGDITKYNQDLVESERERAIPALAARIDAAAQDFIGTARAMGERGVAWHAGITVTPSELGAIALVEALLHGGDIARSQGRPWRIEPQRAALGWEGMTGVMPHFVVRDAAQDAMSFEIRLRGRQPLFFLFGGGDLRIEREHRGRVDCHISGDPAAFLMLGYGRLDQVRAAVTGKVLAWGRKPWLALKLPSLLTVP